MTSSNYHSLAALGAAAVAVILVPWSVWLAVDLPATATAAHWRTAWVGLDVLEAAAAATSAVLLARRDPRAVLALVATSVALVLDAWFDVTTSAGADLAFAVGEAALAELPLAGAAAVLAVRCLPAGRSIPTTDRADVADVADLAAAGTS